ncbi:ER membrane protein complex subunit 10-like isoform X2 [Apostichopus japonicus]|uniref:ER membrane protein complex subunit 10-like isoform X2 n=1 Tax=Stichopus japonicus TaxID=307972 RepID=UPI003AB83A04
MHNLTEMEEKTSTNAAMEDVRVYITIDPKDLEKLRDRQVREHESKCYILSDVKRLFRDAWEDLGVQTNCQFIVSSRGLVLCSEMILSIILIILVATQWFFEASQAFGIIVNSLTLLSCFFHIFVKVTELDKLVSSHALVIAVQLLKDIFLLVLQFAAFIAYMACSYYFPVAEVGAVQYPDDVLSSSLSLPIQHSFQPGNNAVFTERGFLNFKSLNQGIGSYLQSTVLSLEEINQLKELATSGGYYRTRVPTQLLSLQTSEDIDYVSSYMKACSLLESNMSDDITIHADQSGHVLGISILPVKGTCTKSIDEITVMDLQTFNTTVTLSLVIPGPVPDTQAYLDKIEEEKMQKKANGTDNRSFFAKYWMYIVPVVLFLMLSGGQEQGRGGGS